MKTFIFNLKKLQEQQSLGIVLNVKKGDIAEVYSYSKELKNDLKDSTCLQASL